MEPHGYIFKGKAGKAAPDYIPSLIGVNPNQPNHADHIYFERVDLPTRRIETITKSPYLVYDSQIENEITPDGNDIILGVRGPGVAYYIPLRELIETAAANQDDDTFELLAAQGLVL